MTLILTFHQNWQAINKWAYIHTKKKNKNFFKLLSETQMKFEGIQVFVLFIAKFEKPVDLIVKTNFASINKARKLINFWLKK